MKGRHLKIKYSPISVPPLPAPDHRSTDRSRDALIAHSSSGRTVNPRIDQEPLLTAAAVAERLNVSIRSVRRMISDGRLPVVRIGRLVRVRPKALEAMIEA